MNDGQVSTTVKLARQIGALLAGHGPAIQGAVLAELTAVWLAGHIAPDDDPAAMLAWRREVFELHCNTIWRLVELSKT